MQNQKELQSQLKIKKGWLEDRELQFRWEIALRDPISFLKDFVYTYDPHGEPTVKKLYQQEYLYYLTNLWLKEPLLLVAKSRQMLVTWLFVALFTWDAISHKGRFIFFQSKKEDDAGNLKIPLSLLSRVKFIVDNIDERVRPIYKVSQTPPIIRFMETGSVIHGISQDSEAVRQYTATGILADELAFQENAERAFEAVMPTLIGGGRFTGVSSANGKNFFYRLYADEE